MTDETAHSQLATKGDLRLESARLDGGMDRLQASQDAMRGNLEAMRGDIDAMREDMRRLTIDQARLHGIVRESENRMTENANHNAAKILEVLTSYVSQVQAIDRRQVITSHRVDELERRLPAA